LLHGLTNRDFVPIRMGFAHARNVGLLKEIHRLLRCPVEFTQPTDCWALPQSVMELPILSKDSRLLGILETHGDHLLEQKQAMGGLQGVVDNQLVSALAGGKAQAAEIADQLGMSVRSLRRQLAEEDTSFGDCPSSEFLGQRARKNKGGSGTSIGDVRRSAVGAAGDDWQWSVA
jgi:AraC-like DNA-binding protein